VICWKISLRSHFFDESRGSLSHVIFAFWGVEGEGYSRSVESSQWLARLYRYLPKVLCFESVGLIQVWERSVVSGLRESPTREFLDRRLVRCSGCVCVMLSQSKLRIPKKI